MLMHVETDSRIQRFHSKNFSNEGITSNIGLSRKTGAVRTRIEVSHPGYYQYHGQEKPEVWSGNDGFVNILSFDTGAHMWSTVLTLCKVDSTEVVSNFDEMVYRLCKAHKKGMVPGYVSVSDIDHHTLFIGVRQRKLVEANARIRVEANGSLTLLSYTVRR